MKFMIVYELIMRYTDFFNFKNNVVKMPIDEITNGNNVLNVIYKQIRKGYTITGFTFYKLYLK